MPEQRAQPWRGLVLVLAEDRAVVGPEAAALLVRLLDDAMRRHRADGIVSSSVADVRRCLATVEGHAGRGHADVRSMPGLQACSHTHSWGENEVSTREAAGMLGISDRQVRRLAEAGEFGPVRRAKGSLRLSRDEVAASGIRRRSA